MNDTKQGLVTAFKKVVCRKSFQKTTISDITKEYGMSRENFYYHFQDKYDLLKWLCTHELTDKIITFSNTASVEDTGLLFIDILKDNYQFYRTLIHDLGEDTVKTACYPYFKQIIYKQIDSILDDDVWKMRTEKENFIVDFFTNAFISFFMNYILEHEKMDESMLKMNFHFLFSNFLNKNISPEKKKIV